MVALHASTMLAVTHKASQAIVFVIVGLALTFGGAFWMTKSGVDDGGIWVYAFLIALFVVGIGAVYGFDRTPPGTTPCVKSRAPVDGVVTVVSTMPSATVGTAYRGVTVARERIAVSAKRVLSPISATWTVVAILACSVLTATALPLLFAMPRWIEIEIVLGTWWLVWAVVLGVLAHRGQPLDRDFALGSEPKPANPARVAAPAVEPKKSRWSWLDVLGCASDGEGLVLFVVGAAIVGLAIVASTIVVDFAAPLLFLVAFTGVQIALRRSLAAKHRGQKLKSAAHGLAWATCYVAPLAAVVGVVHVVLTP